MSTVGLKSLRAAIAAAAWAGLDPRALLATYGLEPSALEDPDLRFARSDWLALWEATARHAGDPGIGMHAAARLAEGHWDVIDYIVASSETLGAAFARFESYSAIVTTGVRHTVRSGQRTARIVREHLGGTAPHRIATEFAFTNIVLRFGALTATRWRPSRVTFTHGPSVPEGDYARVFGCPVRFRAVLDAIEMPAPDLALPMKRPAPELCAVLERHAALLVRKLPDERSPLDRVRHALGDELRGGVPSLASVARRLGLGARTLQRCLAAEGVTYRALVEEDARRSRLPLPGRRVPRPRRGRLPRRVLRPERVLQSVSAVDGAHAGSFSRADTALARAAWRRRTIEWRRRTVPARARAPTTSRMASSFRGRARSLFRFSPPARA